MKRRVRKQNSMENVSDFKSNMAGCSKSDAYGGDINTRHLTRDRRQDFDSGYDLGNSAEDSYSNSDDPASISGGGRGIRSSTPSRDHVGSQRSPNYNEHQKLIGAQNVYKHASNKPNSVDSFASMDGIGISIESDDTGVALSATSGELIFGCSLKTHESYKIFYVR